MSKQMMKNEKPETFYLNDKIQDESEYISQFSPSQRNMIIKVRSETDRRKKYVYTEISRNSR